MSDRPAYPDSEWPVLARIRTHGYAMLDGFTAWLETISPAARRDAWNALREEHVAALLRSHRRQLHHQFLRDEGDVDPKPQLSINFAIKDEKSHLTVVHGADWGATHEFLPDYVRAYLRDVQLFVRHAQAHLDEVLPACELRTTAKARIFDYSSSDIFAGLKPVEEVPPAMKNHVDGSVFTLVVAESDGCLCLTRGGVEFPVLGPHGRPFAVLIPGVAARHDFGLEPTPHSVRPTAEGRNSLTLFLTPMLGCGTREAASNLLSKWRCSPVPTMAQVGG